MKWTRMDAFECPSCREIYGAMGYAFCPPCGHVYCKYRPDLWFLVDNDTGEHKVAGKEHADADAD